METLSSACTTLSTLTIPKIFLITKPSIYSLNSNSNTQLKKVVSFTPFLSATKAHSALTSVTTNTHHWMVLVEDPPQGVKSKSELINYYVATLQTVLGSEKDAQMCIYDAYLDTHFGFCCEIDEETSGQLAGVQGVLSVRPDPDHNSEKKDYRIASLLLSTSSNSQVQKMPLFPGGNSKHWLVQVEKPATGVVTKAQMVDYYAQLLNKVMGNEKDAQMCIYHISWQSNFGFCCELDDECAGELAGVPGVLSVKPDKNFDSNYKDYRGESTSKSNLLADSWELSEAPPIRTKKLFVTVLCRTVILYFEKTLRAAFEVFGELVEVKIIMDKISKRSKGYAFIEYTTEEAASAALKDMNGKIINGWMIAVYVAKDRPPKYSWGRPQTS